MPVLQLGNLAFKSAVACVLAGQGGFCKALLPRQLVAFVGLTRSPQTQFCLWVREWVSKGAAGGKVSCWVWILRCIRAVQGLPIGREVFASVLLKCEVRDLVCSISEKKIPWSLSFYNC